MIFLDWTAYFGMCHSHHFDTKKLLPLVGYCSHHPWTVSHLDPKSSPSADAPVDKDILAVAFDESPSLRHDTGARLSDPINLLT
jgi:hypothetical protein